MRFGVVVFPGSNCDDDMLHVLGSVLGHDVKELWHKDTDLQGLGEGDCIIVPGGFSYGDYLRAGAIARFSPIMKSVVAFAEKGGYVFGICNGFQILCEAGLLPGVLLRNANQKFVCKNVYLRPATKETALTADLNLEQAYKIPIAHAEGRYHIDDAGLAALQANRQILFRYCDASANISKDANPNGTLDNIAGICNAGRNVFGMMPHPERASEAVLGNTDGRAMFESLVRNAMVSA